MDLAVQEQAAKGDYLLVADGPHHLAGADAAEQKVDVSAGEARGVRAGKFGQLNILCLSLRQIRARRRAQIDLACGETSQQILAEGEGLGFLGNNNRGVRGQRMGVDGGDEDGRSLRIQRRHAAEGARAQCGPLASEVEMVANGLGLQCPRLLRAPGGEAFGGVALDLDHYRLQDPAGTAVDGRDHAARGGSVAHTIGFLVGE